jgi:hypothetical protein
MDKGMPTPRRVKERPVYLGYTHMNAMLEAFSHIALRENLVIQYLSHAELEDVELVVTKQKYKNKDYAAIMAEFGAVPCLVFPIGRCRQEGMCGLFRSHTPNEHPHW